MILLGFSGKAKSGKSTAARAIIDHIDPHDLTAKVYDIGQMVLGYCIANKILPTKRREDLTTEELATLVRVGYEQRQLDPYFWINKIKSRVFLENPDVAIIPNIRYLNEAEWVRENGGQIIRLLRFVKGRQEYQSPDRPANHPSETELDNYDADFYIASRSGEAGIVGEQAITVFEYVRAITEEEYEVASV